MGAFDTLSDDDYRVIQHERKSCDCVVPKPKKLNVYCIEFKSKGDRKQVFSAVIVAENERQASEYFDAKYIDDEGWDIDKRTIKWGGNSMPLAIADHNGIVSFVHFGQIEND